MACNRGAASPDAFTKLKLFAASAGFCQNPECNRNLFSTIGNTDLHIGEMAHIISVSNESKRSNESLTPKEKGDFSNLILLCPTCHTIIDKAETEFPEATILQWKNKHGEKINQLFNIKEFFDRTEARNFIEKILLENKTIFELYGPYHEDNINPESELPQHWKAKIFERILPNNRNLLNTFDKNYQLLNQTEKKVLELYRQHVLDFENKHINKEKINAKQFPQEIAKMYLD